MNEALKLACKLYAYVRGDEYQRVTEEAAAVLCSQHAEIEQLKSEIKTEQSLSFREQAASQAAEIERLQERMDEIVANDDRIIAIQRDEIERLNAKSVHWKKEWITEAAITDAITDALRAENQKLRDALENIVYTTVGPDCNDAARAALVDTRIKGKEI